MRRLVRRLGVVASATAAVTALTLNGSASATDVGTPLTCTASVTVDWTTSGQFAATVTAYVVGSCSIPGWTTCDISVAGSNVYAGERTAGYGWCDSTVTVVGLQNTPYVAVGRVGYSAADVPSAASTTVPVIPRR